MTIKTLIDNASKVVGSRYKLSKILGVTPSKVYDWQEGRVNCTPPDRARIAAMAGEDATRELVAATLESTEGTLRGEQLKAALGKFLDAAQGVKALIVCGLSAILTSAHVDIPRCIKRIPRSSNC